MKPIFCGNFEYDARQSELERLFRRYGKVDRVDMKSGFAFIYMEDERDAEDAIRALDRIEFGRKGRRLRVEWTKHERGIRRPGGGSRRSSGNSRPSKTLFVINFDTYNTRTRDLERHFEPYGKIVSVRIRRNFAFVQYESEDDATRALEATNMSKLLDRVISVEFAVKDDDDRRSGYSPERSYDRPHDRSRDRRRSPSPYRRERGSPDYGHGSSPYKREKNSPDYGRFRSRSPRRNERASPDYKRRSRSPHRRERDGSDLKERARTDRGNSPSHSPDARERLSPQNGHGSSRSPYYTERASPENAHGSRRSPDDARGDPSPYNGNGGSPNSMPEPKDSPNYGAPESPMNERYRSQSPAAEE
ncbi:serine/arginine-rich splicing factor RS40 isoform X1 [Senna tora]|uniref:Serine/arginine-rich splicing factor RS40 isoform X1 n=1 Tax=Senna tora TaxID=362788 RepID=A0A834WDJ4_9FABA|nr:serine/arginine-rich splicing factor RS40 isoform X1 [Senna tora]